MGFMDSAGKAVKFEKIGDAVKLVVSRIEFDVATKNLKNEDVTEDRIHGVDKEGAERTLYVNKYLLGKAIRDAVLGAGKKTLDVGDELTVLHHQTIPSTKAGFNPQKDFQAKIVVPGDGVAPTAADTTTAGTAVSIDDI